MIRVFIIDDEPKVRKALKTLLHKLDVGIEIVGEAESAIKGMELVEQLKPDLLLLDVVMPGMDGFEMLLRMKKQDCQIVIISGYDDFSYVKKAISHNVLDYVLKPFDMLDIKKVIEKVTDRIQHRDTISQMEKAFMYKENESSQRRQQAIKQKIYLGKSLIMQEQIDIPHYLAYEEWSLCLFTLRNYYSELIQRFQSDEELVSYIVVKYIEEILENNGIPHIVGTSTKKSHLVYWVLVPPYTLDDSQLAEILNALKENLKMNMIVIKNNFKVKRDELSDSIQKNENNIIHLNMSLFNKYRVITVTDELVIPLSDKMLIEINKFTKEFHFFIRHGLYDQGLSLIKEHLFQWGNQQFLTVHFIYMLKSSLVSILNITVLNDDDIDPFLFGMKIQLSINEATEYILRFIKDSLGTSSIQKSQLNQDRIEIIKQYIKLQYSEQLSLAELSKKFYISKEYLATSFKKKFNTTVHQYIQQVRLYKSKELLIKENYKISEVALMVGYDNFSYFNKLFRREFNITPSEYRESRVH